MKEHFKSSICLQNSEKGCLNIVTQFLFYESTVFATNSEKKKCLKPCYQFFSYIGTL